MNSISPMNHLSLFSGEWSGEETIAASKWGPGGLAKAVISARLDFSKRVLIQDYSAERDGKSWLNAHAIFTFDEQNSAYGLFWFDSLGFTPTQAAPGQFDGDALKFIRASPRGQTRHTYSLPKNGQYQLSLESSFDDGATWVLVMEGIYSKI